MRPVLFALLLLTTTTVRAEPVVAIDLMRTKPGEQADYLQFIEWNWTPARVIALERGYVASYEVLSREPDGEEWDVMLRTTYPDAATYAAREENFAEIFEERGETRLVNGKGPRDMAEFLDSGRGAAIELTSPGQGR